MMSASLARGSTRLHLAKAFEDADSDKSGTLDKEQFKSILSVVGIEDADDSQLEMIMSMIDFDKKSCVDYAEFCQWVQTKLPASKTKSQKSKELVISAAAVCLCFVCAPMIMPSLISVLLNTRIHGAGMP
jgi:Ca2+-binding EF-hand superfamily protein